MRGQSDRNTFASRGSRHILFLTRHWLLHGLAQKSFPAVLPRHWADGLAQRRTVESECVGPQFLGQYLVYRSAPVEISRLVEKEFVVVCLNEQTKPFWSEKDFVNLDKELPVSLLFCSPVTN